MISSQSHGSVYDRVIGKGIRHDQMHQRITCTSAPGFETENKISNSGGKEDAQMEDFQDLENKQKKENPVDQKDKKWKRKTKRCEILDCAFSANSDGLSIADMADDTQMSMEEMIILKEESRILHEKIDKLSLQEQFIIKSIYFDDMKQKDVVEILGVTKGALSQRLNTILRKMRNMHMEG